MATRSRKKLPIRDCWLYAIVSKRDLARRLDITMEQLSAAEADGENFRHFSIRQNGKERKVQEPKPALQRLHRRIHTLLSRIEVPDYLHSAVKGRSYLSNARAHALDAPTIKIDVKKFFPSVPRVAIYNFFRDTMRCRADVAGCLADILTYDRRLPTGSSASPVIAYYAFKPMFDAIHAVAIKHNLKMTCYVDDITLSGEAASRRVLDEVRRIIARFGLKSHKMKLFSANRPKIITGVCNSPSGERVPNRLHLKISQGFEEYAIATTASAKRKALQPLLGRLEAARQIDPVFGARAATLRAQARRTDR